MINLKSGVAIFAMNFYNAYVRSYTINENNEKEFFDIVRDVYFSDEVQGQAMYIQHADINRLQHVTMADMLKLPVPANLHIGQFKGR